MQVLISTFKGEGGQRWFPESVKSIDWNDSSDRRWLMNHLHHCMMNNKRAVLTPESN